MKELIGIPHKLDHRLVAAAHEFRTDVSCCTRMPSCPWRLVAGQSIRSPPIPGMWTGWSMDCVPAERRWKTTLNFKTSTANGYMAEHYSKSEPLNEILDGLVEQVESLAKELRALPSEAWARVSSHVMIGRGLTLQTWVEKDLAHIEEHLETIRKTGGVVVKSPVGGPHHNGKPIRFASQANNAWIELQPKDHRTYNTQYRSCHYI